MPSVSRRFQATLVIAALAGLGMLLAPGRWFGLDAGAIGGGLLYGVLWLSVILLARNPESAFPDEASYAERRAWVELIFVTLIAIHFANFIIESPHLGADADSIVNAASRRFGIHLGTLMVGWVVVLQILRSNNAQCLELDERDLRVHHAASNTANGLMITLIIGIIATLVLLPDVSRDWTRPMMIANVLIGLLLARSLAESLLLVLRYRRARA